MIDLEMSLIYYYFQPFHKLEWYGSIYSYSAARMQFCVPYTVFRFLPAGTINFSARQDAGTIRGREQNKGGVNTTRQRMQFGVLAHVRSVRHAVLIAASNERSRLSWIYAAASAATPQVH